MITPCPHCRAEIEIDAETRSALKGQSHFACPMCQGAVPVPPRPRLQIAASESGPRPTAQAGPTGSTTKTRGPWILIGAIVVAVVVIVVFVVSRQGGSPNGEAATKPETKPARIDGLVANGEWQDMLGTIWEKQIEIKGAWQKTDKGLELPANIFGGRIHALTEPLDEFEALVRYTSPRHHRINLVLPSPTGSFEFSISQYRKTVGVGDAASTRPEVALGAKLVEPLRHRTGGDKPHEFHVFVTPRSLKVMLDGEEIFFLPEADWMAIKQKVAKPRLGLMLHEGTGTFESFKIRIPKKGTQSASIP
jgi:hypothetical protein